jgi:hypothetical protein
LLNALGTTRPNEIRLLPLCLFLSIHLTLAPVEVDGQTQQTHVPILKPKLKRKTNTQLHAASGFGRNGLSNRSGGKDSVYHSDVGVVQQILATRAECKRARISLCRQKG